MSLVVYFEHWLPRVEEHSLTDRATFGAWLRRERERRGLALDLIANRTKIAASLLAGLEEGDLSRWPTGIFRRAFVRAYADAVGLDPERLLAEFAVVHPEAGQAVVTVPRRLTTTGVRAEALRLTLADGRRRSWLDPRRIGGALVDALVVALTLGGLWFAGAGWVGVAGAWLLLTTYVGVGALFLDGTPGLWLIRRAASARDASDAVTMDERQTALGETDVTVVPFQRGRRRRRVPRAVVDAERPSRAGGEGRARTH